MRHVHLTFWLITLNFLNLKSQDWASLGTEWYYTVNYFGSSNIGYSKIESVGDTVIKGINCRILERSELTCDLRPSREYMYEDGNKIYYYEFTRDTFNILYDFEVEEGDIIEYPLWPGVIDFDSTYFVRVDSVKIIELNSIPLKHLFVSYSTDSTQFYGKDVIIEKIGSRTNLFPVESPICDGPYIRELRCYSDTEIGTLEFVNVICDLVKTDSEGLKTQQIELYPNPVQDALKIKNVKSINKELVEVELEIYTLEGKKIYAKKLALFSNQSEHINMSHLNRGFYVVRLIINNDNYYLTKLIKK